MRRTDLQASAATSTSDEARLERAAREFCRLTGEDPDGLNVMSDEPNWRAAAVELRRYMHALRALCLAQISLS